jgi:hypothetical protein
MNIDWIKAPEGATHWDIGANGRVAGWMKLDDGIWYWWPVNDATCGMKWRESLNKHVTRPDEFIARPAVWTGEGLPPVGVLIEMKHKNATAEWARPDFHEEQLAWVGRDHFVTIDEKFGTLSDYLFRPIRTPDQIAAEERENAIQDMLQISLDSVKAGNPSGYSSLAAVYDAGYRKQVTP